MTLSFKIVFTIIITGCLVATAFVFYGRVSKEKLAYIELDKVFKEFEYKKELEIKLIDFQRKQQHILDSLEMDLKILSRQISAGANKNAENLNLFEIKRENFFNKKNQFENENQALVNQFDDQIFLQLNQYVQDFGNQHEYDFIFSAEDNGTIMYGKEGKRITEEVLQYVNLRYKGKTK